MSAPFDGRDLLVGEIAAIRTFSLRSDGALWPVFAADRPWVDGDNTAACVKHEVAGATGCKCGFWAYGSVAALRDQPAARNVAVVVSCWGRVTPGTRGLRAQCARIDAIWLSPRVRAELVERVAARYPQADVYRDRDLMLAEHPLTPLPSYRTAGRPALMFAARALSWAFMALVLVAGLLPRSVLDSGWGHQLHYEAVEIAAYVAVAAVIRFVVDRRPGKGRQQYAVLLLASAALMAWVWSPYASWLWQVLLRLPVLIWIVRAVLNRTVRFVPVRAAPPPVPPPPPPVPPPPPPPLPPV